MPAAVSAIENPGTINARDTGIDSKNQKNSYCTTIKASGYVKQLLSNKHISEHK